MNKEEAIKILNDYDINFERNTPEEVAEAHEMAIEALKAQPSEDWNAVLDELNRIGRNAFKDDTDYDNLFDFISNLPNVKPQPKTGHWIGHREYCEMNNLIPSGLAVYEWCSNCGNGIDIRDWSRIGHNYCPKCGIKMQEVKK